ncbi:hypothetical protein ILUMI_18359 [Ignelater luminosus]|uniref:Uncharacterized protein n=1 Tax=Ignelater luminosus TaxID=2038154 RepID=A0A8K0CI65_IGNLU|nr:hypothetical protein ILUMI_18359 [Ignelater luminosus]
MCKMLNKITEEGRKVELELDMSKTKVMIIEKQNTKKEIKKVIIENYTCEVVEEFKYLDSVREETKKSQTKVKLVEGNQGGFSKDRDREYRGKSKRQKGMDKDM